ncbi:hypothetical protein FNV43_RR05527 [Rhamnella rubrinervis]|uniref:RecA family profile 1 domain-containing protein n=1 Tax=Rhamnella rubrinervis TaxID=2594499 RepID=A0A8K0HIR7_9ROSA|nr:hypothetical protein FNV43_RR03629 [Rhamnella rubrinervis]KAF3455079.1 hypothetical protein FNV43_RR05527 [Rhamnella rubrinervis]
METKLKDMGLPKSIANVFAARNITTAKEALSLTEFELMQLLDVGLADVASAVARISEIACPPYQTVLSLLEQRIQKETHGGHLPTRLKGLDKALCGGIPFGVLTELVGPAGIGKTQFCMKLSLLASLPEAYGGLNGRVIYIDVESKLSSRRIIEIGAESLPEIFHIKGMAQEMAGRILVLRPSSLLELTESLQQIKVSIFQHQVKLLVIDSMAAAVSRDYGHAAPRQHPLGWHISFIKSLAESSRIPVVVTNQVRSQSRDEACQYAFQEQSKRKASEAPAGYDSHLVAALGIHWAHAVTIRLVLEAKSGQRFIKLAKSPISPPIAFPFTITSSGISLLNDDGQELKGTEISTIQYQGFHKDIFL